MVIQRRVGYKFEVAACIAMVYAGHCSSFTSTIFFKHGMIIVAALLHMYPEDETY
jgi:hypothetical protein